LRTDGRDTHGSHVLRRPINRHGTRLDPDGIVEATASSFTAIFTPAVAIRTTTCTADAGTANDDAELRHPNV
jgi:hypothetical protein